MHLSIETGIIKISAATYILAFAADRPFVYLSDPSGNRLAELFTLSSVHPLNGRDDTLKTGSWQVRETQSEIRLSLQVTSSVWEGKTIAFHCEPDHFTYEVEVEGQAFLAEANYFGGYSSANIRWGTGFFWSGQNFLKGFNPEPNSDEVNYFSPAEGSIIDLMGVPLPGRADWFFTPPPFCFAFQGKNGWAGVGVEADAGGFRFTEYSYHTQRGAFYLSLAYEGHTRVDGRYRLPAIGFYFGQDEFSPLEQHVQAVRARLGTQNAPFKNKPLWWYEPIFCGWGSQCYTAGLVKGKAPDYARQEQYQNFIVALEKSDICPGMIVLDDKWQANYGVNHVDTSKWPDLPGFIRQQHRSGRKVLLWLKAWDPECIPLSECITNACGNPVSVDPSNPAYEERLRQSVRLMLSKDGYDADGFKIDFSARIPSGPGMHTCGDLWGLELMRRYLEILYSEAKQVKPDALVMTHTPHPYLADIVDMIRLNDINALKDVNQAMQMRAKIASIACPDAIIDTDNWPMSDKASWRKYLLLQPELGVPSLYYSMFIDSTKEPLSADDYQLIREVWMRHRLKLLEKTGQPAPLP